MQSAYLEHWHQANGCDLKLAGLPVRPPDRGIDPNPLVGGLSNQAKNHGAASITTSTACGPSTNRINQINHPNAKGCGVVGSSNLKSQCFCLMFVETMSESILNIGLIVVRWSAFAPFSPSSVTERNAAG